MKLRAKISSLKSALGRTEITLESGADSAEVEKLQDKTLDVELKVHREHRSLDANACLWACLGELAGVIGVSNWDMYLLELKAYGQFTQVRVWAEALPELKKHWRELQVVGDREVEVVTQDAAGYPMTEFHKEYIVNCYYGSHTYNTKEFSRLLSGVIDDMKGQGLDTPPSEEMKRMLRDMEEKERKDNNARL